MFRLLPFLLICTPALHAQEPTAASFKGKVKTITEHSYKAKQRGGEIVKGKPSREYQWEKDYKLSFDSTGLKYQKVLYRYNGKHDRTIAYTYDEKGFLKRETITEKDSQQVDVINYDNLYNDTGAIVRRIVTHFHSSSASTFMYTHDALGNIHELFVVGEEYPQHLRDSRLFDRNWNITKQWYYTNTGSVESRHEFAYDGRGHLTEEQVFNNSNLAILLYRWKYDTDGNLERREICSATGQNCEAWTYKYEYDKSGNWIRSVDYRNGRPVYIREREITYF